MIVVEGVEIAYFRSIYKQSIKKINNTTVFFGKNDTGKSNFLRALNLFFTDKVDFEHSFNFDVDFSKTRSEQAKEGEDVRRFVYVKVFFKTPKGSTRSLGKRFYVKKSWNSTGEYKIDYSSHIKHERFVTGILNKIDFHYVPAVKDRNIFSQLLLKVYGIISKDQEFRASLSGFSKEIQIRTEALSEGIFESLVLESAIAPPEDISALFGALDFDTKKDTDKSSYSLILQRGDGVQTRHIPEMLKFISDHGGKPYHIWGLEEPENSLELSSAMTEAKRILHHSMSNNIQVFITSHSPAFYNLEGENCKKLFVQIKTEKGSLQSKVTDISKNLPDDNHRLMDDTFYLRSVATEILKLETKLKNEKINSDRLREVLRLTNRPVLFVEGPTDETVLKVAWEVLFDDKECPFDIQSGNGASKLKLLREPGILLNQLNKKQIFVLVDYDFEGRIVAKGLTPNDGWKTVAENCFWATYSPSEEATKVFKHLKIPAEKQPITLESCFSSAVRLRAMNEDCYTHDNAPYKDIREVKEKGHYKWIIDYSDDKCCEKFYIIPLSGDHKLDFSNWVRKNRGDLSDELEIFRKILDGIREKIE